MLDHVVWVSEFFFLFIHHLRVWLNTLYYYFFLALSLFLSTSLSLFPFSASLTNCYQFHNVLFVRKKMCSVRLFKFFTVRTSHSMSFSMQKMFFFCRIADEIIWSYVQLNAVYGLCYIFDCRADISK